MAGASGESRLLIAVSGAQATGFSAALMAPLVTGGLIAGLHLSPMRAAGIVSIEFLVTAVTALAVSPYFARVSLRTCGILATVVVALGNIATLVGPSSAILESRCLAGVGEGAAYAVSLAAVAAAATDPERLLGKVQIMWAGLGFLLFAVGGHLLSRYADHGVFSLLLAVCLCSAPTMLLLPRGAAASAGLTAEASSSPMVGIGLVLGIAAFTVGQTAIWSFTEQLGRTAGISADTIGFLLGISSLLGFAGGGLAVALGRRAGRVLPICAGMLVFAVAAVVLCLCHQRHLYTGSLFAGVLAYYFVVPYLFGGAAAIDAAGRWAAAAGSANLFGFAGGPAFAGWAILTAGYHALAIAVVAVIGVALLLLVLSIRALEAAQRASGAPQLMT